MMTNANKQETDQEKIARLEIELAAMRQLTLEQAEQLRILKAREYGRRSEKQGKLSAEDIRQGLLFDEAELHALPPNAPPEMETVRVRKTVYQRRKKGRKPIDETLARVDVIVDLPSEMKQVEPGFELIRIGEDTSEQIHEIPQRFLVIRTIRIKYVKRCIKGSREDELSPEILCASLPQRILPRSIATPSLLAQVLTGKFCDGLPFYRQEKIFARHGLDISRQDMANWAIAVAKRLEPLLQLLKAALLAGSAINCDETWFQVLDEPGKTNSSKSYMWVVCGGAILPGSPRVVLFRYSRTRQAAFISDFLEGYKGYLQTDGYDGYNNLASRPGVIHAGCWAHARRKFVEAHEAANGHGIAKDMIALIQQLYISESELRAKYFSQDTSPDLRAFRLERKRTVKPAIRAIKTWLDTYALEVLPSSALGKAIAYTISEWPKLLRYIFSPWLMPDNNVVERAIRPFTVGRKNWVLSGGPRGAFASADLYSLIETAKLNGLEPYYYMRYIMTRFPDLQPGEYESLLPWNINPEEFNVLITEDARLNLASVALE